MSNNDPFHQGYMDGLDGEHNNPFGEGTWQYEEYENGYEQGYEEDGLK